MTYHDPRTLPSAVSYALLAKNGHVIATGTSAQMREIRNHYVKAAKINNKPAGIQDYWIATNPLGPDCWKSYQMPW